MFSFLKKKKQLNKDGGDSTVSAHEMIGGAESSSDELVETELSLHPSWNLPKEQEYVFRFLNNELSPLQPNQISISGAEWEEDNGIVRFTAFIRNSVSKAIVFEKTELLLLNEEKQVIARKEFDLAELGEIPAKSSRPWFFNFSTIDFINREKLKKEGWSLSFNVSSMQKHRLDLDENWKQALPQQEIEKLENHIQTLPKLKTKEFNLSGLAIRIQEDESIAISLLLRNGNYRSIKIEQLPLTLLDANGDVVAQGVFKAEIDVKANTTRPWTFIFPKEKVVKDNPDLSKWKVVVPQK
jgi:accessory Sec system S-layer assembly protein